MKVLIVFAHPNENSFNGAVLKTVTETLEKGKHEVRVRDLYRAGWNPLLSADDMQKLYAGQVPPDIADEQENVAWAELVVFIYPIWWFEQPAILKGWLDRVFSHGFAYRIDEQGMIEGLLKGRKAVVITTSGANEENMKQNGILEAINTCMIRGTLAFSGFSDIVHENLYAVPTVTDEERRTMLDKVKKIF
jgi:NAD(P)H dehydrogenase (quinone)